MPYPVASFFLLIKPRYFRGFLVSTKHIREDFVSANQIVYLAFALLYYRGFYIRVFVFSLSFNIYMVDI
jgi:hypothetical protein